MTYTVTAPLIVAKDKADKDVYVYAGQPVPEGLRAGEVDRLLEGGFIASDGAGTSDDDQPSKTWTVEKLKDYATENGVDLGDATKKDDILAAIVAAQG